MEETKKISLLSSSLVYLIRHFNRIDQTFRNELVSLGVSTELIDEKLLTVGSKFDSEFASNPRGILDKLNQRQPNMLIAQANNRTALIYQFEKSIGFDSIIHVSELTTSDLSNIQEEKRGEQTVRTIELCQFPETNQIVVIIDSDTNNVITFYPGCYAPPFPALGQMKLDYEQSDQFWGNHIFIKRKSHE